MYRLFGTSPPTRACVAADLPPGQRVCIDIIAYGDEEQKVRQSLHVQSLSYWAPANIGPYSQSITVSVYFTASDRLSGIRFRLYTNITAA